MLESCNLCPRYCGIDRGSGHTGFCNSTALPSVSAICVHKGEEPALSGEKGVCNVFFAHCNMQCLYCQNIDISYNKSNICRYSTIEAIVQRIAQELSKTENMLGFVSPSHQAHLIPQIMDRLHSMGIHPATIYNTNCYDSVETLQRLEPYIDIYLPDFKYSDNGLAARYSRTPHYFETAGKALREMYRQKGSTLITDSRDIAQSGLIIRHLVLPGCVENSKQALLWIAENLSVNVHLSLMAQYYPPTETASLPDSLDRCVTPDEYEAVCQYSQLLGFHRGWEQELSQKVVYRPHFENTESFEQQI